MSTHAHELVARGVLDRLGRRILIPYRANDELLGLDATARWNSPATGAAPRRARAWKIADFDASTNGSLPEAHDSPSVTHNTDKTSS